jgi:tRNA-Thr(GGU) m(6)t(6)A37 methyltransferase TsaA
LRKLIGERLSIPPQLCALRANILRRRDDELHAVESPKATLQAELLRRLDRTDDARGETPIDGVDVNPPRFELALIGRVESPLTDPELAPKQGDEGAPDAWLIFEPSVLDALDGLRAGDEIIVLTWLDRARRDILRVHPRGDVSRAQQGVFNTRSPHRPNPLGLHRVEIASIDGARVRVRNLEAVDGTPIVDLKPVLSDDLSER